jgi:hypothetical protein
VNIEDYVSKTLIDISKGVEKAKREALVGIAPGYVDGEKVFGEQLVNFEIVVTVSKDAGGSLKVLSLADIKAGANVEHTNRVSFSVPVFFQAPPATGRGPSRN